MARHSFASVLTKPVRTTVSVLHHVPGAGLVRRAADGTLDAVERVSPRGRRMAVYTGAGVLGVAGLVEWPVAAAGAAVAWLTQAGPGQPDERAAGTEAPSATGAAESETPVTESAATPASATGPAETEAPVTGPEGKAPVTEPAVPPASGMGPSEGKAPVTEPVVTEPAGSEAPPPEASGTETAGRTSPSPGGAHGESSSGVSHTPSAGLATATRSTWVAAAQPKASSTSEAQGTRSHRTHPTG